MASLVDARESRFGAPPPATTSLTTEDGADSRFCLSMACMAAASSRPVALAELR